jgi:hypothetical protein
MDGQNIIRKFVFMVFFGIGAVAIGCSILCDDLTAYFRNKFLLNDAQESLARVRSLNADYDALLGQLEADPNLFERIAPAALGIGHQEPNTVYPSATVEQLAIARRVLSEQASARKQQGTAGGANRQADESNIRASNGVIPAWLSRCSEPRRRIVLFFAGAGLILTSFVCFDSKVDQRTACSGERRG